MQGMLRALSRILPGLLCLALTSAAGAQSPDPTIAAGADWLLTQQSASGAYPWTLDGPLRDDTQGHTARGMLVAYLTTGDPMHLDSAVSTGLYLVGSYPRRFPSGEIDFFPLDPIFLEELSLVTQDPQYADFVQVHLWDRLKAGTYGANQNLGAAAWAAQMPVFPEYAHWTALDPYFRASAAVAAHYAGELSIRDALMTDLVKQLEDANNRTVDLAGLSASIWASAHTGINLNPLSGYWKNYTTTQQFVNLVVSYQRTAGDWPYDSSSAARKHVGDTSTSTWALKALKAWDASRYADNISRGLQWIRAQQQPNGQILTNPGYPPDTETGVLIHGEALVVLGTNDGTPFEPPPPANSPPVAVDDFATTLVGAAVAIDVLANDSDPDGSLDPGSVQVASGPAHGTADVAPNGMITYTPTGGFEGGDAFTYTVADDQGARSNPATVHVVVASPPPPPPPLHTLAPVADTHISQAEPSRNFGASATLDVRQRAGLSLISLLKFDVPALPAPIRRAWLLLYVSTGSGQATTLYQASNFHADGVTPWTESGLAWSNADLNGTTLATFALQQGTWIELDVTSTVSAPGTYSFALLNAPQLLGRFSSKEGANPPRLVIETE
jgi:hypothetical protein